MPYGHDKSLTFTTVQVLDGPMTCPRFRDYVTAVMVPTLRPGDTVVMDNLPCPKAAVRAGIAATGRRLLDLPPYSPDLNPIEMVFAKLKQLFRSDGCRAVPAVMTCLQSAATAYRLDESATYIRHRGCGPPTAMPLSNQHRNEQRG